VSEGGLVETEGTDFQGFRAAKAIAANQECKEPLASEGLQAIEASEENEASGESEATSGLHRQFQVRKVVKACQANEERKVSGAILARHRPFRVLQEFKACRAEMEETAFRACKDLRGQKATLALHRPCLVRRGNL
jgi:hypothetical protein